MSSSRIVLMRWRRIALAMYMAPAARISAWCMINRCSAMLYAKFVLNTSAPSGPIS